jgi:FKBP-type peptidyl-prolyl cis-trans isomerase
MTKGIKIEDLVRGGGDEALRGKTVVASVRIFLNDGTELTSLGGPKVKINLGKREYIAGLRLGIEGMRVGGVRRLVIAPHLAYGARGVSDRIPPQAFLRCEVELLEVRDSDALKPEDYPPGQQLFVFCPGEAARNLPQWQFHLEEDGHGGVGVEFPIPGMTWRHTRRRAISLQIDRATAAVLFQSAIALPSQFPEACLRDAQIWADSRERANSITRDRQSNSLCLTISVSERGQYRTYYSIAEDSRALLDSELYRGVSSLLEPYLAPDRGVQPSTMSRGLPE